MSDDVVRRVRLAARRVQSDAVGLRGHVGVGVGVLPLPAAAVVLVHAALAAQAPRDRPKQVSAEMFCRIIQPNILPKNTSVGTILSLIFCRNCIFCIFRIRQNTQNLGFGRSLQAPRRLARDARLDVAVAVGLGDVPEAHEPHAATAAASTATAAGVPRRVLGRRPLLHLLAVVLPEGEHDGAAEFAVRVPQQPLQFLLDGEAHQVLARQDALHLAEFFSGIVSLFPFELISAERLGQSWRLFYKSRPSCKTSESSFPEG